VSGDAHVRKPDQLARGFTLGEDTGPTRVTDNIIHVRTDNGTTALAFTVPSVIGSDAPAATRAREPPSSPAQTR